jgi:hypothetical protein
MRGARACHYRAHLGLGRLEEVDRRRHTEGGGGARGGGALKLRQGGGGLGEVRRPGGRPAPFIGSGWRFGGRARGASRVVNGGGEKSRR